MSFEIHSGKKPGAPVLTSVELWGLHAPPTKPVHWREGRSAKELARAWTQVSGTMPLEVAEALGLAASRSRFCGLKFERGLAEAKTYFSDGSAGPRNHDLFLVGACGKERVLVDVEGKERETFGKTLAEKWRSPDANKPKSGIHRRIRNWSKLFIGLEWESSDQLVPELQPLRYQLLSGLAGAVARAKIAKCQSAVFLIHQFKQTHPEKSVRKAYNRNDDDLMRFLKSLNPDLPCLDHDRTLVRLIRRGEDATLFDGVELYVAKATRDVGV
jgi:hypothetical protein